MSDNFSDFMTPSLPVLLSKFRHFWPLPPPLRKCGLSMAPETFFFFHIFLSFVTFPFRKWHLKDDEKKTEIRSLESLGSQICLNRSSRRKRGMASNPLFIIANFFCIFPMNFAMATLALKENGKCLLEGREKSLPSWLSQFSHSKVHWENAKKLVLWKVGWTPCLFSS